jgi:MoaA/NifB/PqqE/SkfB family radical SAM enzyme
VHEQSLLHTLKRYTSLRSGKISVLPIAILMPHSACNCRCVMCDIWKGNKNAKQLTEEDIQNLLKSLKELDTKRVVMSGGEALLNKNFFRFCEILKQKDIKITLLSTGLTLDRHAENIIRYVDDVIVSLDGDRELHDEVRNIKGAFDSLATGVNVLKTMKPGFPVAARCVIHRFNFEKWDRIIMAAKNIGLDSISFLPADVSSQAFNRETTWDSERQDDVLIHREQLPVLQRMIDKLITELKPEFESKFIAESPQKIQKIYQYYSAQYGLSSCPQKGCNAPWVSVVVEADGAVRPCFFHDVIGSIKDHSLSEIINSPASRDYRKKLDTQTNATCVKCVCYLNLSPRNNSY